MPHAGIWGEWTNFSKTSCEEGFINGVKLETDVNWQLGATNIKMYCTNNNVLIGRTDTANR